MLRVALARGVFCYQDLRVPSRIDRENFDHLYDLGLFALAPTGAVCTRSNEYAVHAGDPIGLFVVTEKGKEVAELGLIDGAPRVPFGHKPPKPAANPLPKPSAALVRRPADLLAPWQHAADPMPPRTATVAPPPSERAIGAPQSATGDSGGVASATVVGTVPARTRTRRLRTRRA
jgi:hypothetical protein